LATRYIQRNSSGIKKIYQTKYLSDFCYADVVVMGGENNRLVRTVLSISPSRDNYTFHNFLKLPKDIINIIIGHMDIGTLLCFSLCKEKWRSKIYHDLLYPYHDLWYYIPYTTRYRITYQLLYRIRK